MLKKSMCLVVLILLLNACTAPYKELEPTSLFSEQLVTATTAAITPTARPVDIIPSVVHTPATSSLSPATLITFPTAISISSVLTGQVQAERVVQTALDETHIYWTSYADPKHIFRHPLQGGAREAIVSTQFPAGDFTVMPPLRSGHWLIFVDAQHPVEGTPYKLRALNLINNTEQVIIDSADGRISLPWFDAEEEWLVWTNTEFTDDPNCTQTVLTMHNLHTNEHRVLDRICAEGNYIWMFPDISENYLILEQDLPDVKGGGSNIYLYDWLLDKFIALTDNGRSSMPSISAPWVVWKDGQRFAEEKRKVIYNLQTGSKRMIKIASDAPRLVNSRWLYWHPQGPTPIYAYDLQTEQLLLVANPSANGLVGAVTMHSDTVAWWHNLNADQATGNGRLEWLTLP